MSSQCSTHGRRLRSGGGSVIGHARVREMGARRLISATSGHCGTPFSRPLSPVAWPGVMRTMARQIAARLAWRTRRGAPGSWHDLRSAVTWPNASSCGGWWPGRCRTTSPASTSVATSVRSCASSCAPLRTAGTSPSSRCPRSRPTCERRFRRSTSGPRRSRTSPVIAHSSMFSAIPGWSGFRQRPTPHAERFERLTVEVERLDDALPDRSGPRSSRSTSKAPSSRCSRARWRRSRRTGRWSPSSTVSARPTLRHRARRGVLATHR